MNHKILCSVATLALVLVGTSANAQYNLSIDSATAAPGDTVTLAVTLDSSAGDNLQGWSYGVCHDSSSLTILASDANSLLGPLAATANGGSAPDFVQGTVESDQGKSVSFPGITVEEVFRHGHADRRDVSCKQGRIGVYDGREDRAPGAVGVLYADVEYVRPGQGRR